MCCTHVTNHLASNRSFYQPRFLVGVVGVVNTKQAYRNHAITPLHSSAQRITCANGVCRDGKGRQKKAKAVQNNVSTQRVLLGHLVCVSCNTDCTQDGLKASHASRHSHTKCPHHTTPSRCGCDHCRRA